MCSLVLKRKLQFASMKWCDGERRNDNIDRNGRHTHTHLIWREGGRISSSLNFKPNSEQNCGKRKFWMLIISTDTEEIILMNKHSDAKCKPKHSLFALCCVRNTIWNGFPVLFPLVSCGIVFKLRVQKNTSKYENKYDFMQNWLNSKHLYTYFCSLSGVHSILFISMYCTLFVCLILFWAHCAHWKLFTLFDLNNNEKNVKKKKQDNWQPLLFSPPSSATHTSLW